MVGEGTAPATEWELLQAYGIPCPRFAVCEDISEALSFLQSSSSGRIYLKGITQGHKTALGLVARSIASEAELRAAWLRLSRTASQVEIGTRLFAQEEVPGGLEIIVGGRRDPVFGPVVLLGFGGLRAERVAQSRTKLAPLEPSGAAELVEAVLGRPDPRLAEIVLATARLVVEHYELAELDINPVILGPDGPLAVDVRVIGMEPGEVGHVQPPSPVADPVSTMNAIVHLLEPRSVAVVGASRDETKPGGRVLRAIVERGDHLAVYPVNRHERSLAGVDCSASIDQLPEGIDTAVVATAAAGVEDVLAKCADRGVTTAVVFASGFREVGGLQAELRMRRLARERGIRICGVNSIGVIGSVPLTFSHCIDYPDPLFGTVSYLTQSGALGGSLLVRSWSQGLGTARFVCVGNQTDLTMSDFLRFLAQDSLTRTVGVFLEGVEDGREFREAARAVTAAGKGLAVLKAGTTPAGSAAAASHTGSLAGADQIYAGVLDEIGAVRARDLPELVGICQALNWQPRAAGRRLGLVATSGGACTLLADDALDVGLKLPKWGDASQSAIRAVLPPYAALGNPLDTTGNILRDPGLLGRVLTAAVAAPEFDVLLVGISTLLGGNSKRVADDIITSVAASDKPVVVGWSLPEAACPEAFLRLRRARVPTFDSYATAVRAAAALACGVPHPSAATRVSGAGLRPERRSR